MNMFKQLIAAGLMIFSVSANAVLVDVGQTPLMDGDGFFAGPSAGGSSFTAENFTFNSDVSLTTITWWGSYLNDNQAPTESFSVQIFSNFNPVTLPLPLNVSFSGLGTDTGFIDIAGSIVYEYSMTLSSPLSLVGGVEYYLSVYNTDGNADSWFWLESAVGDSKTWFINGSGDWEEDSTSFNVAFKLVAEKVASIPEPAPMALILLPVLWIIRQSFFNKKSSL